VPDEAIKADTRETKPAPAIQEADNALKDVESTEKALGKLDAETIRNLGEGGDLTKFRETLSLQDKQDWDKLMELEFDKKANPKDVKKLRDKFKPLEQAYFKENAPTAKSVSEAYHKAKKDGSYPEIVTAVDDLLKQQPSKQKAETPTQDTPTKSDKQQPSKGQAKGSVPTTQEPVPAIKSKYPLSWNCSNRSSSILADTVLYLPFLMSRIALWRSSFFIFQSTLWLMSFAALRMFFTFFPSSILPFLPFMYFASSVVILGRSGFTSTKSFKT